MASLTQANRSLELKTPLGADKLLLDSIRGTEQLSGLFEFEVVMWSEDHAIDPMKIVGKPVTAIIHTGDAKRYVHGVMAEFGAGITRDKLRLYRGKIVPALWMLTRTQNCRIFQNKDAPDIIQDVLKKNAIADVKTQLTGKYSKLEYCVQYQESDFAFISRLMEHFGIFYYFTHEDGKHNLVLCDANTAFKPNDHAKVGYSITRTSHDRKSTVGSWEHSFEYQTGAWTQTDYNFEDNPSRKAKSPAKALLAKSETTLKTAGASKYEKFAYPGNFLKKADGTDNSEVRMQADEAAFHHVQGASDCASFAPGTTFALEGHPAKAENGTKYVLTFVAISAVESASYRSGPSDPSNGLGGHDLSSVGVHQSSSNHQTGSDIQLPNPSAMLGSEVGHTPGSSSQTTGTPPARSYQNSFTCMPADVPFRPQRLTPKPRIYGSQTAVVVGPPGEEIWPDKYGRVRVQFFWDRDGERDENSSCWVRVAQMGAGKGWGAMSIPRVGQEVVITHLEGDPDRPLVTGLVYNGDQLPAYALPDNKTRTYLKTNSSPKGEGFNELRFEDKAEDEHIFMHAQKDMIERVLNDRHLIVGQEKDGKKIGNQSEKVFGNVGAHVLGHVAQKVEGSAGYTVGKGDNDKGGTLQVEIEKDRLEKIGGDADLAITGDQRLAVDGDQSLQVKGAMKVKAKGVSFDSGDDIALQTTAALGIKAKELHLKADTTIAIEAGTQLTLKVGGNFVVIDASGVSIMGTMVNLNSGGAAGAAVPPPPKAPDAANEAAPEKPKAPKEDDAKTGSASAPESLQ